MINDKKKLTIVLTESVQVSVVSSEMSGELKVFKDGNISRGAEDIKRMYVMTYEDSSKNLHMAHHLYLVIKPAQWVVK